MRGGTAVLLSIAIGATALLASCVAPIAVAQSGLSVSDLGGSEFAFAAGPKDQPETSQRAQAAVEAALISRGMSLDPQARLKVDVAFAIAPTAVEASTSADHAVDRPGSQLALCRRKRYVLSVAALNEADGRVVFRNRASALRCGQSLDELLPALADAVVGGARVR